MSLQETSQIYNRREAIREGLRHVGKAIGDAGFVSVFLGLGGIPASLYEADLNNDRNVPQLPKIIKKDDPLLAGAGLAAMITDNVSGKILLPNSENLNSEKKMSSDERAALISHDLPIQLTRRDLLKTGVLFTIPCIAGATLAVKHTEGGVETLAKNTIKRIF